MFIALYGPFPQLWSMRFTVPETNRALLGTTTSADSRAHRNAGFIRQASQWHCGCRINPAFRWCCQEAPKRTWESARTEADQPSPPLLVGKSSGRNPEQPSRAKRSRDWEFNSARGGTKRHRLTGFDVHQALDPKTQIGQLNRRLGLGCLVVTEDGATPHPCPLNHGNIQHPTADIQSQGERE